MLRVRFAEVSRNALQEVGAGLFSDGNNNMFGRTTTQQFATPNFDKNQPSMALGDTLVFSDYLNLFLFDAKNKIGAVMRALQGKGVFQSLAEPNLIANNGKEASFLAGGEFPYPIPQGNLGSVTIMFKEYGVRLNFTPTVLGGDLINLKIKPEVSSLDFNNAIILEGFRIPALVTRRAETEVELQDGQTFAIAGLMNNTALSQMRKVPGLGDIPVLGMLFKSRAYQKDQTELVVMVTPQIIRRGSTGVSQGLPSLVEPFMPANDKPLAQPSPYVGSPAYPPKSGGSPAPAPAPQPSPRPVMQQLQDSMSQPAAEKSPQPVPSTPIQASAPLPVAPKQREMTEAEKKAQKVEEERQEKADAADQKRQAEDAKKAAKKAEEDRKKAEKLEKERAKRQAEADKKAAEQAEKQARKQLEEQRKKAAEEEKKNKSLADAADRLKQAQSAYQAELAKTNKGGSK
jgi:pilus assembly protein CpaC